MSLSQTGLATRQLAQLTAIQHDLAILVAERRPFMPGMRPGNFCYYKVEAVPEGAVRWSAHNHRIAYVETHSDQPDGGATWERVSPRHHHSG
ncbi:MAG: hypothetical protein PHI71_00250 [Acidiphilium sp.]|nr:hypothetical protein [Acidiphilium sp.]